MCNSAKTGKFRFALMALPARCTSADSAAALLSPVHDLACVSCILQFRSAVACVIAAALIDVLLFHLGITLSVNVIDSLQYRIDAIRLRRNQTRSRFRHPPPDGHNALARQPRCVQQTSFPSEIGSHSNELRPPIIFPCSARTHDSVNTAHSVSIVAELFATASAELCVDSRYYTAVDVGLSIRCDRLQLASSAATINVNCLVTTKHQFVRRKQAAPIARARARAVVAPSGEE